MGGEVLPGVPAPPPPSGPTGREVARATPVLDAILDRAVAIPAPVIRRHVDALRRRNPLASPAQLVRILEKEYATVLSAAGGAVGVAAALPAVGTGAGLVLSSSDAATFFASSAAFALAVAEVHGIEVVDVERRRALLLASVLGPRGAATVEKAAAGSGTAWGKTLLTAMPASTLTQVNRALANKFLRTQLAKHAGLTLGRVVPFGIGAVVGVAGGRALARTVVTQSRTAFGEPPEAWPLTLRVVEPADDDAAPALEHRSPPRRHGPVRPRRLGWSGRDDR
ncbi:hypothetical protein [Luteimicrobium sp. DT211]|uniref:hypothetical protein n=1 Tax=Luteimicrobium sp. DT211 TaxID=3393412 RepID=UPI003CEC77A0